VDKQAAAGVSIEESFAERLISNVFGEQPNISDRSQFLHQNFDNLRSALIFEMVADLEFDFFKGDGSFLLPV
jgi:hypothetical protein